MKELVGLTVNLYHNGDITVIDNPNGCRENFGPEYGSQSIIKGTIIKAEPKVEWSTKWLQRAIDEKLPPSAKPEFELRIRVTIQFNHFRKGNGYTTYWDLTPDHVNYLLNG